MRLTYDVKGFKMHTINMRMQSGKRAVLVYLVPELHRELKKLAADRDTTISHLVELAARRQYEFHGLIAAEAPAPYGRTEEERGGKRKAK